MARLHKAAVLQLHLAGCILSTHGFLRRFSQLLSQFQQDSALRPP